MGCQEPNTHSLCKARVLPAIPSPLQLFHFIPIYDEGGGLQDLELCDSGYDMMDRCVENEEWCGFALFYLSLPIPTFIP